MCSKTKYNSKTLHSMIKASHYRNMATFYKSLHIRKHSTPNKLSCNIVQPIRRRRVSLSGDGMIACVNCTSLVTVMENDVIFKS